MAVISFSLLPEPTARIYEALVCLAKFGENVSIEARSEKARFPTAPPPLRTHINGRLTCRQLTLTALNSSRTGYASFALDAKTFFIDYAFDATSSAKGGDRFTCQLLNKVRAYQIRRDQIYLTGQQALQSVFKGRANDFRGRETMIERCDVSIQDQPDKTECRLIVKMICKHGGHHSTRINGWESTDRA